ncbi:hypothetical protein [Pontivivens insulae]|uniref:Uncharacterized protein n=1 Tax=Pontivivens insulae TaxID=1639689 RepID=A0A2R8AAF3_9RHOB|nr:hypothetical protein [Pontivivens insulae]RED13101.1 hypothetical protein DFR53_2236 [Pontivivens insulae]SPF29193.1 hypothetical protein POI8812_01500 [Pontivivens insulae]
MNTRVGLILAIIILAIFAADHFYFGWDLWIFLMKKHWALVTWIAFWR